MKIRILLKDPDGVGDSIQRAVNEYLAGLNLPTMEEADAIAEVKEQQIEDACKRFIECNEYVTIEIDTDTGTAVVIPVGA